MAISNSSLLRLCFLLPFLASLQAQSKPRHLTPLLEQETLQQGLLHHLLGEYLVSRSPKLPPLPAHPEEWTTQANDIRKNLLRNVVYRGWPQEWVEAPLRFREIGPPQQHRSYRLQKLLIQIVPGLQISALLYEPTGTADGAPLPAVLNVNGHTRGPGKAVEYKQKRCISLARRGVMALNLEWLGCGELNLPENTHWFGAHLDLVGANAIGLFYLAMRKGLDFLEQHPRVDPQRLAVTGLSGGGWQTIILSSLDERVAVSIPVAGYSAVISRIERPQDTGDIEQNATDLLRGQDYSTLTAMRAPKPTLLIYNAEDECCFRAPLVRPYIYDEVKPFFALFGKGDHLGWHENTDPSTHNYQLDNRLQAYRHLSRHFGLGPWDREDPVDREIQSFEELVVGIPEDNLTIVGVARRLGRQDTFGKRIRRKAGRSKPSRNAGQDFDPWSASSRWTSSMAGRSTTPKTGGWNRIPIESTSATASLHPPFGRRESPPGKALQRRFCFVTRARRGRHRKLRTGSTGGSRCW